MSGLLPDLNDLKKTTDNEKKKAPEPIVTFTYDNSPEDTDAAMKVYQRSFGSKKIVISIIAYCLILAASVVMLVFDPKKIIFYIAAAACVYFIVMTATARSRKRKALLKRLENMPPEEYNCSLFPDKVVIETVIDPKKDEPHDTVTSEFMVKESGLALTDTEKYLVLIVNGTQVFCFPKRMLTIEQVEIVTDFFDKINGVSDDVSDPV